MRRKLAAVVVMFSLGLVGRASAEELLVVPAPAKRTGPAALLLEPANRAALPAAFPQGQAKPESTPSDAGVSMCCTPPCRALFQNGLLCHRGLGCNKTCCSGPGCLKRDRPCPPTCEQPTCPKAKCRSGLFQRLRDWLSYHPSRAPRDCQCHCSGTSCTPPLIAYFADRYPYPTGDAHALSEHAPGQPFPRAQDNLPHSQDNQPVRMPPLEAR